MNDSPQVQTKKRGRKPGSAKPVAARPKAQAPPASLGARKLAAAILEVLAGMRTPTEAAAALEISVPRYYHLEQRSLAGLLAACEPPARGPGESSQRRISQLEKELERLQRERDRQQALVRISQRAVGLAAAVRPPVGKSAAAGPKKLRRPRRATPRGLAVAKELRQGELASIEPESLQRASDSTDIATGSSATQETRDE